MFNKYLVPSLAATTVTAVYLLLYGLNLQNPVYFYGATLGLVVLISSFYDQIRALIGTQLPVFPNLNTAIESSLLPAIVALQDATTLAELHNAIDTAFKQLFSFTKVDIFYPNTAESAADTVWPNPYRTHDLTAFKPKQTASAAQSVVIVTPQQCDNQALKQYWLETDVAAVFLLFHRHTLHGVIHGYGHLSAHINNTTVTTVLSHCLQLASGRIMAIRELVAQTIQHQKEKTAIMQALAGSIAHEMRTPLSQLQGILSCIQHDLPLPTDQPQTAIDTNNLNAISQRLSMGFRAIDKSAQVITMTLNEINDKPIDPDTFEYLSAKQITELTLHEYGYQNDDERQRVSFAGDDFTFKGDDTLYTFVLFNLLKNALFYTTTHADATITVTVRPAADGRPNRVLVRDTGPGIPKQALPKLFDSFYTAGKRDGTGLGLAYCKRVMTAFGGDISCDSVEGEYAEFCLTFPAVSPAELQAHNQQAIEQARPYLDGKRVLIVDDQAINREIATHYFAPFAVIIDEAEDGEQAIATLKERPYDLVVMDIQMPKLDGYQASQQIRAGLACSHLTQTIPILGYGADRGVLAKAIQAGMQRLQNKPCSQAAFIQSVQICMQKAAESNLLQDKTVLVVDDSGINRTATKRVLASCGMNIIEAPHGQAALDILAKRPCDIVLMDLNMPELGGLKATQLLRHDPDYRHCATVPVIGLSGNEAPDTQATAEASGMNAYLRKPLDGQALHHALHRCLSTSPANTFLTNGTTAANVTAKAMTASPLQDTPLPLTDVPLICPSQWDNLKNTMTAEQLTRLVANFCTSMQRTLCDYRIAFAKDTKKETAEKLKQMNHKFSSETSQMAAQRLHQSIKALETQLKAGTVPEAKPWLTELGYLINITKIAIHDRLTAESIA